MTVATRFHAWLLSDAPGAAHAFAGVIMGGTFIGIVAFVGALSALVEAL